MHESNELIKDPLLIFWIFGYLDIWIVGSKT